MLPPAMARPALRSCISDSAVTLLPEPLSPTSASTSPLPIAKANISNDMLATGVVVGGVFLITLLLVSIITVRVSDMILDSRIGALDRTLGFLFGLGRGLIIVVVAFLFFSWLVPGNKQPEGVRNAKSRVVLENTGEWLQALLPQDMDNYLSQWFKRRPKDGEQEPPDGPPDRRSDLDRPVNVVFVPLNDITKQ